jgi:hypothetical protein
MEKGVMHPTFGDPEVQLQHLVKTRCVGRAQGSRESGSALVVW